MPRTRYLILSGIAAAMLVAAPQAGAQQQPQTQPPMAAQDFSQEKIEAFADAAVEVQQVQTELDTKARDAANAEEIARVQQEAQAAASQAVEDNGLTVDEYTAIARAANEDPDLYATIVDLMQKKAPQ
jgi:hypothetical protein